MLTFTVLFWICAALLFPFRYFPVGDAWIYALAQKHLFGLPPLALRTAALAFAWIGLAAFYRSLRRLGAGSSGALAGVLTLLFNPVFFILGYLHLADVAVLVLLLLAGHSYVVGVQENDNRRLVLGSIFSTLACCIDGMGASMLAGFVLWLLVRDIASSSETAIAAVLKRHLAVLAVPLAALAALKGLQGHVLPGHALLPRDAATVLVESLQRLSGASLYLGMFLAPWAFSHEPGRKGSWLATGLLAAVWIVILAARIVPATGDIVGRFGLGACTIGSQCAFKGSGPFGEPWFLTGLLGAGLLSAGLLAWRTGFGKPYWGTPWGAYASGFVLAFLLALVMKDSWEDRYYLVLFPPAIVLASSHLKFRWGDFGPILGVLAAWSILGAWDCLAFNEARWKAGERLHEMGIPYHRISNGLDWEEYHRPQGKPESGISFVEAFTTLKPQAKGAKVVGQVSYWNPLNFRMEYVYLWRLKGR